MKVFCKFEDKQGMALVLDPSLVATIEHFDYLKVPWLENHTHPFSYIYLEDGRSLVVRGDPEQIAQKLTEKIKEWSIYQIPNCVKQKETPEQRRERDAFP